MGPQQPANFPFAIGEVAITKGPVTRMATLLTPKNPMVFGRERLRKVQVSTGLSPVEQWMVEHARRSGERARITILRAANEAGERVWSFDPSFDNDTLREAGYVLTKGLLRCTGL